jgi:hypothetical protein
VIGGMRALAVIAEDHGIVPGHEKGSTAIAGSGAPT